MIGGIINTGNVWGNVPEWVVAITAFIGVIFGIRELMNITKEEQRAAEAQEFQQQIARADLILKIDSQFESPSVVLSRMAFRSMRNRCLKAVETTGMTSDQARIKIAAEFSSRINKIWETAKEITDNDIEKSDSPAVKAYETINEIMALPNFFETVGLLCREGLLPKDDILCLYDQAIIPTMTNIMGHIQLRREEVPYANPTYMENAVWLYTEALAYSEAKLSPPKVQEKENGVWARRRLGKT
jgi:hypothetical protein